MPTVGAVQSRDLSYTLGPPSQAVSALERRDRAILALAATRRFGIRELVLLDATDMNLRCRSLTSRASAFGRLSITVDMPTLWAIRDWLAVRLPWDRALLHGRNGRRIVASELLNVLEKSQRIGFASSST